MGEGGRRPDEGNFTTARAGTSAAPPGLEIVLMLNPQLKLWAIIGRHSVAERAGDFS
jgi:hypothetical protein